MHQVIVGAGCGTWDRIQPPFGSLMGKLSSRAQSGLGCEQYPGVCAHSSSLWAAGCCSVCSQTEGHCPQDPSGQVCVFLRVVFSCGPPDPLE